MNIHVQVGVVALSISLDVDCEVQRSRNHFCVIITAVPSFFTYLMGST